MGDPISSTVAVIGAIAPVVEICRALHEDCLLLGNFGEDIIYQINELKIQTMYFQVTYDTQIVELERLMEDQDFDSVMRMMWGLISRINTHFQHGQKMVDRYTKGVHHSS